MKQNLHGAARRVLETVVQCHKCGQVYSANTVAAGREGKEHCCLPDCASPAAWIIWYGPLPYDYTEACTAHVGEMLTDAAEHKVYPVERSDDLP